MKNIHILSTENSSRLSINDGILILHRLQWRKGTQHIYITNDEIVTEYLTGLYFIDIDTGKNNIFSPIYINKETIAAGKFHTYMNNGNMCKKIIMTTDPQLIANGVQAIDDEFLEWFVKNASCEEVEVEKGYLGMCGFVKSSEPISKDKLHYKIIIPQEEPKYVSSGGAKYVFGTAKGEFALSMGYNPETTNSAEGHHSIVIGNGLTSTEHKQETLEEFIKSQPYYGYCTTEYKEGIEVGAKWQAERMYSEEDMFTFSQWISHEDWVYLPSKDYWVNEEQEELEQKLSSKEILNLWFEKFKKK